MSYRYNRSYSTSSHEGLGFKGIIAILIVLLILGTILFNIVAFFKVQTYTVTITDKDYSGSVGSYMIWAEDSDGNSYEFKNCDSFFRGKFNSGTIQGKLKVGNTYRIEACGFRVPFFSAYPNIISYERVYVNEHS